MTAHPPVTSVTPDMNTVHSIQYNRVRRGRKFVFSFK